MKQFFTVLFFSVSLFLLTSLSNAKPENDVISILGMGDLNCIAYSPDGAHFASAGNKGSVYIWDIQSGNVVDTIHTHSVKSIAYSPDGTKIAAGCISGLTFIFDISSKKVEHYFDTDHWPDITSVLFSPDGKYLICSDDDENVKLWDINSESLIRTFEGYSSYAKSISISSDGTKLAVVGNDFNKVINIFNLMTGDTVLTIKYKSYPPTSVSLSSDGTKLVYTDKYLNLFDLSTGLLIDTIEIDAIYHNYAVFSPDGSQIASFGFDSVLSLVDINKREVIHEIYMPEGIRQIQYNKNGSKILCRNYKNIRLLDGKTVSNLKIFNGHSLWFSDLAFNNNGTRIACKNDNLDIVVWDLTTEKIINIFPCFSDRFKPVSFSFSSSGEKVAIGRGDSIIIFEVDSGTQLKTLRGHTGRVLSVALSSDEKLLASSSEDSTVKIWDLNSDSVIKNVVYCNDEYCSLDNLLFSDDSKKVFCRGSGGFQMLNVSSGRLDTILNEYGYGRGVISSDFSKLAVSKDWNIKLFDIVNKTELFKVKGNLSIYALAFSPNGKFLASAGQYGGYIGDGQRIQLWDVNRGKLLSEGFYGHTDYIGSMVFSADGTKLASTGGEGTIIIWRFDTPNSVYDTKVNDENVFISPNPASDYIEISLGAEQTMPLQIRIYDVFGELVNLTQSQDYPTPALPAGEGVKIDVSSLPAGVYFVRVGDRVGKFLKI